jgi:GAF domain-containing protein
LAVSLPNSRSSERRFPRLVQRVVWLRGHRPQVVALAIGFIAAVFVLDILVPGYPFAGFYLVPLTLVAFVLRERLAALLALLCLVLTVTVMLLQERTGLVELMLVAFGSVAAIGLIAFARLQHQVELVSRRAVMRAELAEATAGIIELSNARADLDELVQYTVESVGAEVGADGGILLLLREGEWVGLAGYGRRLEPRHITLPYERFAVGVAALEGNEPVLMVDAQADPRVGDEAVLQHDLGSLVVLPLRAFGQDVGVIVLNRPIPAQPLTPDQQRFATAVAAHAAIAIDNARLMRELESKRHDLALVIESSLSFSSSLDLGDVLQTVVMRVVDVLEVDECNIYVVEDGGRLMRRVASIGSSASESIGASFVVDDYNLTRDAVRSGQLLVAGLDDPRLNPAEVALMEADGHRSQVNVPLKARDEVVGIVELYDRRPAYLFSQEDADLASAIAQFAALAIENARLYSGERDMTRRLQLLTAQLVDLQDVALEVNRLLDPQEILDTVTREGAKLLDAPRAAVLSRDGKAIRLQATVGGPGADDAGGEQGILTRLPAVQRGEPPSGPRDVSVAGDGRLLVVPVESDSLGPRASLVFLRDERQDGFNREDVALAATLGAHLSAGLEAAIAYQREHDFADTFLTALLVKAPVMPGLDVAVKWEWATDLHHGGDFYDFVKLGEGRLMVVIGDLCGKGYHQQAVIAMLRYMLRAYAVEGSPGESLSRLNAALLVQEVEAPFTTLVVGYLDVSSRLFEFAVAGHPRPLIFAGHDSLAFSKSGSYPVGIFPTVYETNRVVLPPESTVVLHTDGFIEARRDGKLFGERRLLNAVGASVERSSREIAADLIERVRDYTRGDLHDDLAVVVLKLR